MIVLAKESANGRRSSATSSRVRARTGSQVVRVPHLTFAKYSNMSHNLSTSSTDSTAGAPHSSERGRRRSCRCPVGVTRPVVGSLSPPSTTGSFPFFVHTHTHTSTMRFLSLSLLGLAACAVASPLGAASSHHNEVELVARAEAKVSTHPQVKYEDGVCTVKVSHMLYRLCAVLLLTFGVHSRSRLEATATTLRHSCTLSTSSARPTRLSSFLGSTLFTRFSTLPLRTRSSS